LPDGRRTISEASTALFENGDSVLMICLRGLNLGDGRLHGRDRGFLIRALLAHCCELYRDRLHLFGKLPLAGRHIAPLERDHRAKRHDQQWGEPRLDGGLNVRAALLRHGFATLGCVAHARQIASQRTQPATYDRKAGIWADGNRTPPGARENVGAFGIAARQSTADFGASARTGTGTLTRWTFTRVMT
jgi:hypothetical protein